MNIMSVKQLPNKKIATRVATCFLMNGGIELRIYERNLMQKDGVHS